MPNITSKLVGRFAGPGQRPEDSEEQRTRQMIFVMGLMISGLVSLVWGISYSLLGLYRGATVGYAAVVLDLTLLALYYRRRGQGLLLPIHALANLFLPFVAQSLLGGIQRSGCLGLWAIVGPLTVLVQEMPGAGAWFAAFLGLLFASVATEPVWAAHAAPMDPELSRLFLFCNLTGVLSILFFPLRTVNRLRRELGEKVRRQYAELASEHANSERLLLNILPEKVARRLKDGGGMVVSAHADVSVLFADISGFTRFATVLPPAELVDLLNGIFCVFDELADRYQVEKIKTIGDAYMVVGNAPGDVHEHLAAMAEMALAMQEAFKKHAAAKLGLGLRLGLHCGPVVAGVIGTKKFSYDLWGDTVNVASRLESHGEPGRVQVSAAVFERLKDVFRFEERGPVELRGRGEMRTWWLLPSARRARKARRPAESAPPRVPSAGRPGLGV